MRELKRHISSYVRDGIKAKYYKLKEDECYMCPQNICLEVHHFFSLSRLFKDWCSENNVIMSSIVFVEQIERLRTKFYEDKKEELSLVRTVCQNCHDKIESIYGKTPHHSKIPAMLEYMDIQKKKKEDII